MESVKNRDILNPMFDILSEQGDSDGGPCIECEEWHNGNPTCANYRMAQAVYKQGCRSAEVSEENMG